MSLSPQLSTPGSSSYDSPTMTVGDGTWDSESNTFLLPNLQGLNFDTMRYNGREQKPAIRFWLTTCRHGQSLQEYARLLQPHPSPRYPGSDNVLVHRSLCHYISPILRKEPSAGAAITHLVSDSDGLAVDCSLHCRLHGCRNAEELDKPAPRDRSRAIHTRSRTVYWRMVGT